jgi:hypothetical protein
VRATVRDFLENDRWSGHALSVSCTSRSAGPTPQARSMRPQGRIGAPHVRKRQVLAPDKRRYLHRRRRAYKRSRDGGEVRIGQSLSVRPHRSCDVRGLRRRYRSHGGLGRLPLATSVASEAAPFTTAKQFTPSMRVAAVLHESAVGPILDQLGELGRRYSARSLFPLRRGLTVHLDPVVPGTPGPLLVRFGAR